jgi:hypothetical protein
MLIGASSFSASIQALAAELPGIAGTFRCSWKNKVQKQFVPVH